LNLIGYVVPKTWLEVFRSRTSSGIERFTTARRSPLCAYSYTSTTPHL